MMRNNMNEFPDMRAFAMQRREKGRAEAKKRKEEFIGARVPKGLRDQVIRRAEALQLPVSTYIRQVLEQAVVGDGVARSDHSETNSLSKTQIGNHQGVEAEMNAKVAMDEINRRFPSIIAWDNLILNRSVPCSMCDLSLAAGSHVSLGVGNPGEAHVFLCRSCKKTD